MESSLSGKSIALNLTMLLKYSIRGFAHFYVNKVSGTHFQRYDSYEAARAAFMLARERGFVREVD